MCFAQSQPSATSNQPTTSRGVLQRGRISCIQSQQRSVQPQPCAAGFSTRCLVGTCGLHIQPHYGSQSRSASADVCDGLPAPKQPAVVLSCRLCYACQGFPNATPTAAMEGPNKGLTRRRRSHPRTARPLSERQPAGATQVPCSRHWHPGSMSACGRPSQQQVSHAMRPGCAAGVTSHEGTPNTIDTHRQSD
jgi:hypothetical protein